MRYYIYIFLSSNILLLSESSCFDNEMDNDELNDLICIRIVCIVI